jgi:NAD(P)-dependent dehydrogenase (short-subunit alcohol dehydrogenase family)
MSKLILLVLGAGSGVGLSAASHFENLGFKVAAVSRRISARDHPTYLTINADLTEPESIQYIFEKVRKDLGEPNVVIYNGKATFRPLR